MIRSKYFFMVNIAIFSNMSLSSFLGFAKELLSPIDKWQEEKMGLFVNLPKKKSKNSGSMQILQMDPFLSLHV